MLYKYYFSIMKNVGTKYESAIMSKNNVLLSAVNTLISLSDECFNASVFVFFSVVCLLIRRINISRGYRLSKIISLDRRHVSMKSLKEGSEYFRFFALSKRKKK